VRVVGSVEISRPASQVWACVADYGNDTPLAGLRDPDARIDARGLSFRTAAPTLPVRWRAGWAWRYSSQTTLDEA
jgi:hypothetical protein